MLLRLIFSLIFLICFSHQSCKAFQEVYKNDTFQPAEDDHWKHRLIKEPSEAFIEGLFRKSKFKTIEELREAMKMTSSEETLEKMGDFVFDKRIILGAGVEGTVYLAQHIPSRSYAAVKRTRRTSEFEAFKNLGRCYGCFKKDEYNYFYTPLITGTTLHSYSITPEDIGISMDQGVVKYGNWPHNLKLLDAYLNELQRCLKHEGIPQELDAKSMFVIEEPNSSPQMVFVDLDTGYYKADKDVVPNDFCTVMLYTLGINMTSIGMGVSFPKPITQFKERIFDKTGYISLIRLKQLRDLLVHEMKELGH